MSPLHDPTTAIALELIGLAIGAGLMWLGASLHEDAALLDEQWRPASHALSVALTAAGLWWPTHLLVESYGWRSAIALLAAVVLPLGAGAMARHSRARRAPGLAVPGALTAAVAFVLAGDSRMLDTGSTASLVRIVGLSIGLTVAMIWLRHAARQAAAARRTAPAAGRRREDAWCLASAMAASTLAAMIEWAPHPPSGMGPIVQQMSAMLIIVALGATLLAMLRQTGRKVAVVAAEKDREALERDPLTHLPTHRAFEVDLARAARTKGDREPLVVLFVDLDAFKDVNESFGRTEGDRVLVEVARRLQKVARPTDLLARSGADDFLLASREDTERKAAEALAQRIILRLSQPYALSGRHVSLTCSVGIVRYPKHGPVDRLVVRAEAAAKAAKRDGGARHRVYDASMDSGASDRLTLGTELRAAIERGGLELYYQPKVDAASHQVTGAEALLRWNHPWHGLLGPGVFVPVAESSSLIEALGNWVIEEACRQIGAWRDEGLRMRVSVNLSPLQLRQPDLVPRIQAALRKHRVEASLLTCEITESTAMSDTETTQQTLRALGEAGLRVSIDDFGTGYSSLGYLRKLPAEELKIDRSFVSDLEHSADARAIADAVVKLAHALGLKVVAEGVENETQAELLLAMGCNQLQGYFFGKPMPAQHLLAWALDHRGRRDASSTFRSSLFVESDLDTDAKQPA
jgi:diguanylate cyclase (GGDEF)-like protein